MLSLESLKIVCDFPNDLVKMAEGVNSKKAAGIKKSFASVYDFLAILYYYKFEMNYENSHIAKLLGDKNVENIHHYYYNLQWHYSNIFEENEKLRRENEERLKSLFNKAKSKINEIDFDKYKEFATITNKDQKTSPSTYKKYGIDCFEDYKKVLFYLLNIENSSPLDLSIMFGLSVSAIHKRLEDVGLNLGSAEGMARKKQRNRQDYGKTRRSYYSAQARDKAKNLTEGSINENYFRVIFSSKIYDYFKSSEYDIVLGVNNTGILGQKEIDIPLMIYSINTNTLYRFVLEYNGEPFHTDDEEKIRLATQRGWVYKAIFEKKNSGVSNNKQKLIDKMVIKICTELRDFVLNDQQHSRITPYVIYP